MQTERELLKAARDGQGYFPYLHRGNIITNRKPRLGRKYVEYLPP